ncbi:EAL domain-containing protein [uncultured Sphingomonas sp.]|uniref:EAL domain-containing protein n=1 Tax=uncultured Sphingomonas sp. TaxID=158754 RepID=UPI0025F21EA4|nr:EAL domain-containing protein [uncultured Sphingomonas sp.]
MPARSCTGCRDGDAFDIAFSMAFQPIVDVRDGTPFAYEALVRGPEGQGALTVLGQVTDHNRYAFDQACRVKAIETAMAAGIVPTGARLSINFLPNAVYSPMACIQLTLRTAQANAFPLDRLIFEFTENEQLASPEHVASIIETYRQMGFSVAIDDFGAGHSGLDLFARFANDMVKLDMDLVRNVDADRRRQAIVRAVVGLCADLDTILIAEGIETEAEARTLHAIGVRYMQGFLFARPAFEALPEIAFRL